MTENLLRHFLNMTIKYKIIYKHTKDMSAANSTLARGGVSSALDSFVVAENSVLRIHSDTPYTFYQALFIDTNKKFKSELTDFSFNKYDSLAYIQTI